MNESLSFELQTESSMPQEVQVGTILIDGRPLTAQALGLQSEPYAANWGTLSALDCASLNRKLHAAGWNFFFMAAEVRGVCIGAIGVKNIQTALRRMLERVRPTNFNCLEITGIVAKRFLGLPYTVISAHSRHIQQSCYLEGSEARRKSQHDAERVRS